jgi:exopolyphosphatase/guanosine-5'-triphosphate,3'-diphosphate pyrophosphatase
MAGRRAAIDIGTNSVKLTVLDFSRRPPRSLSERVVVTRLGEGVDGSRRLRPDAIARTARVVRKLAQEARSLGAEPVVIATEAVRRARNRAALFKAVTCPIRVLDRKTEARMSYLGARTFLRAADAVLVDIGGGTIELMVARSNRLVRDYTLPLGCVYLTERFLNSDPPRPEELSRLENHVEKALGPTRLPRSRTLVGIGGSVATVAHSISRRKRFDTELFNGARIPVATLDRLYEMWRRVDARTRVRAHRIDPKRADVILAAMAVLRELARRTAARIIVVCTYGVRHGVLLGGLLT